MSHDVRNTAASTIRALTFGELETAAGGQQVFSHQFPGAVNQMTGLRSFEPSFGAAVADATMPVAK